MLKQFEHLFHFIFNFLWPLEKCERCNVQDYVDLLSDKNIFVGADYTFKSLWLTNTLFGVKHCQRHNGPRVLILEPELYLLQKN